MIANYFDNQEIIAKNLISFMRQKGYSRLSLTKLTEIARPAIDLILSAQNTNESVYSSLIMQINQAFELPEGYLLTPAQTTSLPPTPTTDGEPNELAQELMDGLNNVLYIYSMYLK